MKSINLIFVLLLLSLGAKGQPTPCIGTIQMAASCQQACLVCDLDQSSGKLRDGNENGGVTFDAYCSTQVSNISYISFIAGSTDLTIEIEVSNCLLPDLSTGGGLQAGIYESSDCNNFLSVSTCLGYTLDGNQNIISTTAPLTIGNHYYLVMDGMDGSVCNWSINVLEGATGKPATQLYESVCTGECFDFNGTQLCDSGTYQQTVSIQGECDEIIELDLVIEDPIETFLDINLCNGDAFSIGNESYNTSGQYQNTLTSINNCDSTIFLNLLVESCELQGGTTSSPTICYGGSSGSITFEVIQGTPPFQYQWLNVSDNTIFGSAQTNFYSNNIIDNLPVGMYQLAIVDAIGDNIILFETVTQPPPMSVDLITSDYNGYEVSCTYALDGVITAEPTGGVPNYNYLWNNGQFSKEIRNIPTGDYTVTITDSYGCQLIESISIQSPDPIIPNANFIDPTCEGLFTGQIEVTEVIGGVGPFQYSLVNGNYQSMPMFSELGSDFYEVFVIDANFCTGSTLGTLTAPEIPQISLPDIVGFELGESIILYPEVNDVSIGNIEWSPNQGLSCYDCLEPEVQLLTSQTFTLGVTSEDGCDSYATIDVIVQQEYDVFIPNIFSPNADGFNDIFTIGAGPEASIINLLEVYDRWGNRLYTIENIPPNDTTLGWDGFFQDKVAQPGVYAYNIEVTFIDNTKKSYSGAVTVNY